MKGVNFKGVNKMMIINILYKFHKKSKNKNNNKILKSQYDSFYLKFRNIL